MAPQPKDIAIARQLAAEVAAADGAKTWRRATTLLDLFGVYRLTPTIRERIGQALTETGLVSDPPLDTAERQDTLRLSFARAVDSAPVQSSDGAEIRGVRSVHHWYAGHEPIASGLNADATTTNVVWIDLDPGTDKDAAADVSAALVELCGHIPSEVIADLLVVDETPEAKGVATNAAPNAWKVSIFSVATADLDRPASADAEADSKVGTVIYQDIELLVGDAWIISCCHDKRMYRGSHEELRGEEGGRTGGSAEEIIPVIVSPWLNSRGSGSARSLATFALDAAAVTYRPATEAIRSWLNSWELSLYHEREPERRTLVDLRALLNGLRLRLTAQQESLVRIRGAWVAIEEGSNGAGALEEGLKGAAGKVDEALQVTDRLGDSLRSGLEVAAAQTSADQLKEAQRARQQSERLETRITFVTVVLLVPTLVVGIYGANTSLPGRDTWRGFWIMIALMIASVGVSFALIKVIDSRDRKANTPKDIDEH